MKRGTADPALRRLPSISALLAQRDVATLTQTAPRSAVVAAVRAAVEAVRSGMRAHPGAHTEWVARVRAELDALLRPTLRGVINATGIVLHTNLGRAPLADEAVRAIEQTARGYTTLEYDLETGERGSRHTHCVGLLRELTGAEDALVVNNCAAAMVLVLNTLATGKTAIVSRGELIEIGGSFRIPDIMTRSAAELVEVGTTNRTHLLDYRSAVTPATGVLVKVHRSNFAQTGYTTDVPLRELAALGTELDLPVLYDLGSGLLSGLEAFGFPAEPTVRSAVADGADVVIMSGDKLLGGPQAGIVIGKRTILERIRSNPLARALRVDKLTIAALEATLRLHTDPANAVQRVPTLAMLCAPPEAVRERAATLAATLQAHGFAAEVVSSAAAVGAGAFPAHEIPSSAVALEDARLAELLRRSDPPVVARVKAGRVLLDLRSVSPREDTALLNAVLRTRRA